MEYEKEDGKLLEYKPLPTEPECETFEPNVIDEMVSRWTISVDQAKDELALWKARQKKLREL